MRHVRALEEERERRRTEGVIGGGRWSENGEVGGWMRRLVFRGAEIEVPGAKGDR